MRSTSWTTWTACRVEWRRLPLRISSTSATPPHSAPQRDAPARKISARGISKGGRDRAARGGVELGWSERPAALTLWVLAAASGGVAVAVRNATWPIAALVVPAFVIAVVFFLVFI